MREDKIFTPIKHFLQQSTADSIDPIGKKSKKVSLQHDNQINE